MMGFPNARNYLLLHPGSGNIACMQSTERPEAAFLVTPWDENRLKRTPELNADQRACLQYTQKGTLFWFLVLNPFTDPDWVLANTRAPVALNAEASLGMQAVQMDDTLDLHFRWMPQPGSARRVA